MPTAACNEPSLLTVFFFPPRKVSTFEALDIFILYRVEWFNLNFPKALVMNLKKKIITDILKKLFFSYKHNTLSGDIYGDAE